jgi:hypothetical protein
LLFEPLFESLFEPSVFSSRSDPNAASIANMSTHSLSDALPPLTTSLAVGKSSGKGSGKGSGNAGSSGM